LIVSRNANTSTGLSSYFDEHGVATTITHHFDLTADRDQFTALVVFPDEFPVPIATAKIPELALRFSRAWVLVVTSDMARFDSLPGVGDLPEASRLLVMPRPVWGWALLDRALRPPVRSGER
jgi:hypothetical protein